jgi:uncharacterized damage-inducible protein DinB
MSCKDTLARYLRTEREGLLWKVQGLGEYDLRLPRTRTGTNLLGLVRHCLLIEHGYLVTCLGRSSSLVLPEVDFDADPNGDFVAAPEQSSGQLIALYRDVAAEVQRSIDELELDSPAHVEWWGDRGDTTMGHLLLHVIADVARHAGHADILREGIDGAVGLREDATNIWEPEGGWEAHVGRLTALAEPFRDG